MTPVPVAAERNISIVAERISKLVVYWYANYLFIKITAASAHKDVI